MWERTNYAERYSLSLATVKIAGTVDIVLQLSQER